MSSTGQPVAEVCVDRFFRGVTGAALVAVMALASRSTMAATIAADPSDFNGDGYVDLAIGVPGEDLGGRVEAGAVNVLYGSATGLTAAGDQLWTQDTPGVKGSVGGGTGDYFGRALASGDFDRDGYADLAIGVPRDRAGTEFPHPGAVNVLYGSASGLSAAGDQRWSQANLPGHPDRNDEFGADLAAGDFDGDGYSDLAIGVRGEAVGGVLNRGLVQILFGGPDGLAATGTQTLTRAMTGADYDPRAAHWFGQTLAAGDLDGDGFADLAVGAPAAHDYPGDVSVLFGGASGLTTVDSQLWSQSSPGLVDDLDPEDRFGGALEIGNWNGDAYADLAIGVEERFEAAPGYGRVQVLYGTAAGPTAAGTQSWSRDTPGVPGSILESTGFGIALASGDFDGDGYDELAVGADVPGRSGEAIVLRGTAPGLTATGVQVWSEDSGGVPGTREDEDLFGYALAASDYGRSGRDDLAIGSPGENGFRGRVVVLFGDTGGLSGVGAQAWSQDTSGVKDRSEAYDFFGDALAP